MADSSDEELDDSEDYSDVEERELEGGWRLISDIFSDRRPEPRPQFTAAFSGINPNLGEAPFSRPSDAFKVYFDRELVSLLCDWTNQKAEKYFQDHPEKKGKVNNVTWKAVTPDDMYTFIALKMAMGITRLPCYALYWSRDPMCGGPEIFCHHVMSCNRFTSILKFLRFSPVHQVNKEDPGTRVEPYLDVLRQRSQMVMVPHKHVAVDEALVLWKGQLSFRQYIKSKRTRFGLKLFVLCPSSKTWNGYSWNFHVYYGKEKFRVEDPDIAHLDVSEKIVILLMKDLLGEGRQVITDNWYTSLWLSDYLLTKGTMMTGVVRPGRGPPRDLLVQRLERHQSCFARKGNTLIVKYSDKNEVTVLTTKYEASMVEKTKSYQADHNYKPLHIDKYNAKMGSVDFADQMLEPYEANRKSLAWFKKLGIHFIFRCLLNSFIAYRAVCGYSHGFMKFILQTSEEILVQHNRGAEKIIKTRSLQRPPPAPSDIHQFVKFKSKNKQKRCRICYPKRKDTRYYCPGCPGDPGLCSVEHYHEWHDQRPWQATLQQHVDRPQQQQQGETRPSYPRPGTSSGHKKRRCMR